MEKKTIFKVLAGVGAGLAGFGLVKLITNKDNEEEDYETVEDGEYEEESESIDDTE